MSDFEHVFEQPPEGAAADWTIPQNWAAYTEVEHQTWDTLYARQMKILPGRACDAFLNGLRALDLNAGGIPDFEIINPKLQALTGWTVVCVPGLVPDEVFFDHLANRRFVSGQFIRKPDQLDYLQEPDIFHDVFGHVPMLTDPDFAAYMEAYGKGGQRAAGLGMLPNLARLYWYTVEFGLIRQPEGLRAYGAGILSSVGELQHAVRSPEPHRLPLDLLRTMRTQYKIDTYQANYFVIENFAQLFDLTAPDFTPLYRALEVEPDIPAGVLLPGESGNA